MIDAEVDRGTASPTVEPGVGVIIVGHSMGGIVGAEACLGIARECFEVETSDPKQEYDSANVPTSVDGTVPVEMAAKVPVPENAPPEESEKSKRLATEFTEEEQETREETAARKDKQDEADVNVKGRLFPKVIGLLGFDTPYLGIAPGVLKHNAEEQWQQGKAWYDSASTLFTAGSTVSSFFGLGKGKEQASAPQATPAAAQAAQNQAKKSGWGRTALMAGTGIAALAGTAGAAYVGREQIANTFNWAGSHLEFVGCLARDAELRKRFGDMTDLTNPAALWEDEDSKIKPRHETLGFRVFYTLLAPVLGGDSGFAGGRTFCRVPQQPVEWQRFWTRAMNDKARHEIDAHTNMFDAKNNPQYDTLVDITAGVMKEWVDEWN